MFITNQTAQYLDGPKELESTADRLYGVSKILTPDESRCLVLLLEYKNSKSLLKVLTSVSNLAAFTVNQDLLRRFGIVKVLKELLLDEELADSSRVMLIQCISNLAVNVQNQKELRECVPLLVSRYFSTASSQLEKLVCIQALTNLATDIDCSQVKQLAVVVPSLYQRIWSYGKVNLPVLKLLVNFSCATDMVPYLLMSKCPSGFLSLLNDDLPEEILVRSTCFLCNLTATVDTLGLTLDDLIRDPGICSNGTTDMETLYYALFGPVGSAGFRNRTNILAEHTDEEIAQRSLRILQHLNNIEMSETVDNS